MSKRGTCELCGVTKELSAIDARRPQKCRELFAERNILPCLYECRRTTVVEVSYGVVMAGTEKCKSCGVEKDVSAFSRRARTRPELFTGRTCTRCVYDKMRANGYRWKPDDLAAHNAAHREYRRTPKGWAVKTLGKLRARAKESGYTCNLSYEDLMNAYPKDGMCPALGVPLTFGIRVVTANSPTVDRLEPLKGYSKGNIRIISHLANRIKQDAAPEELEAVAKWLRNRLAVPVRVA